MEDKNVKDVYIVVSRRKTDGFDIVDVNAVWDDIVSAVKDVEALRSMGYIAWYVRKTILRSLPRKMGY